MQIYLILTILYRRTRFFDEIRKAGYPEGAEGEAKVNEILAKISTERGAVWDKIYIERVETLRRELLENQMDMDLW